MMRRGVDIHQDKVSGRTVRVIGGKVVTSDSDDRTDAPQTNTSKPELVKPKKPKRGRKPTNAAKNKPFVKEMWRLAMTGEAISWRAAADKVTHGIVSAGDLQSTMTALQKHFTGVSVEQVIAMAGDGLDSAAIAERLGIDEP